MKTITLGNLTLSAWLVAPGVTRIQTNTPQFQRKLGSRNDARLFGWSVADGYLRIFDFEHNLAWARRLIDHYQKSGEECANEPFLTPECPPVSRNAAVEVSARSGVVEAATRETAGPLTGRRLIRATGGKPANRRSRCAGGKEASHE
jgi:hypothetical protein